MAVTGSVVALALGVDLLLVVLTRGVELLLVLLTHGVELLLVLLTRGVELLLVLLTRGVDLLLVVLTRGVELLLVVLTHGVELLLVLLTHGGVDLLLVVLVVLTRGLGYAELIHGFLRARPHQDFPFFLAEVRKELQEVPHRRRLADEPYATRLIAFFAVDVASFELEQSPVLDNGEVVFLLLPKPTPPRDGFHLHQRLPLLTCRAHLRHHPQGAARQQPHRASSGHPPSLGEQAGWISRYTLCTRHATYPNANTYLRWWLKIFHRILCTSTPEDNFHRELYCF